MAQFEQTISDHLCEMRKLLEMREVRDTRIFSCAIPESPTPSVGTREFAIGDTIIDFQTGIIDNPEGTTPSKEQLSSFLDKYKRTDRLRSITITPSKNIVLIIEGDPLWQRKCNADYDTVVSYIEYTKIRVICTYTTDIQIFACTNPEAIVTVFKAPSINTDLVTMLLEYDAVNNPLYIGQALAGTLISDAGWRIKKFTYDSNNNLINIRWADGNILFDNIWNDRTTLTYS